MNEYSLAFDREAESYDERFNTLAATQTIREWLWRELRAAFPPGSSVLDIGCGTGEDAAALTRSGVRVLGVDTSPQMVARARRKCGAEFRVCDISTLDLPPDRLRQGYGESRRSGFAAEAEGGSHVQFDGILSNFGALNCLGSLDPVRRIADRNLRPGGLLFLVVINRWYLRELGRFELRRLRPSGTVVRCGGCDIALHYHPPRRLRWPGYRVRRVVALASWSHSDVQEQWPLNRLGDHYLAVVEKNPAPREPAAPAPPA